jgi:uncharacterized protein (DUF433 family)
MKMATPLRDRELALARLSEAEKAHLAVQLLPAISHAFAGIERRPGVCGGDACVVRTRIPVWTLEQYRRLGWTEAQILDNYPPCAPPIWSMPGRMSTGTWTRSIVPSRKTRKREPMASFYANENLPRRTVEALRSLGHDVLTTQEAGNAGQAIPDDRVLEFATSAGRAVLTLNRRDFIRLHKQGVQHAGIVVRTEDLDTAAQALRVHEAVSAAPELTGQLIRVNRPWAR